MKQTNNQKRMINKRGRAEEVITNIAECPVCLDSMIDKDLFQCTEGHLVCGSCYGRLIAPKKCAKCRGNIMTSRCTAMELFMKQIPLYECPHTGCHRKFTSMECSIDHDLNDSKHKCEGGFYYLLLDRFIVGFISFWLGFGLM